MGTWAACLHGMYACLRHPLSVCVFAYRTRCHTDRPLGRPRGPLLQQHVGLLVVQRRLQPLPSSTLFVVQVLNCYRSR